MVKYTVIYTDQGDTCDGLARTLGTYNSKKKAQLYQDAVNLKDYVESQRNLLRKYLYIDPDKVYNAIANGTWQQVLDINKLKTIANVLSEKDLYISAVHYRMTADGAYTDVTLKRRNSDVDQ